MQTPTRTAETPWQAIDILTDATVGWYDSEISALNDNKGKPEVRVYFRPKRKRQARRQANWPTR